MASEWNRATFTIDNILHTEVNYLNGIASFLTQSGWVLASWSSGLYGSNDRHFVRSDRAVQPRWQFVGDGPLQHAGIRVFYDSNPNATTGTSLFTGQEHIVIQSFLQNTAETDRQVLTPDFVATVGGGAAASSRFGTCRIVYDPSAPNNVLIIGGEDGLYLEAGRDASPNNLGHASIMTFGAIPELFGVYDDSVRWTAQGLVADLFDRCRFTHDRSNRFVANDGANKNFSCALQPYSARGTASIVAPNMFNQRPYYIGSRDSLVGMGAGSSTPTANPATSTQRDAEIEFLATFGLANTPEVGRFRISPLLMVQDLLDVNIGAVSTSAADNIAPTATTSWFLDPRRFRQVFRFAACDHTLLPSANIQDGATGAVYRVSRVEDGGRFSKLGVEWPGGSISVVL
jgi:hypothetical protein